MYTWGYLKDVILAKLDLDADEATVQNLIGRFAYFANEVITQVCSSIKPKCDFAQFSISDEQIGKPQTMPGDFISFGDDVCYKKELQDRYPYSPIMIDVELHDDDFSYHGYNKVIFNQKGEYYISYNARWYTFSKSMADSTELDIPTDILDCIPSYVASQCYKIDDEYKAQVYRNEYEMMLARIDNTNFKNTKTIKIGGDW